MTICDCNQGRLPCTCKPTNAGSDEGFIVSEFQREERYVVIKLKKLTNQQWTYIPKLHDDFAGAMVDSVVIESDWPEYNFVWLMLEHRMAGFPVPDFNAVKCAADVAAAQAELAALREEVAQVKKTGITEIIALNGVVRRQSEELTAAEQRNAELVELLRDARWRITNKNTSTDDYKRLDKPVVERIDAALKPTESGASE